MSKKRKKKKNISIRDIMEENNAALTEETSVQEELSKKSAPEGRDESKAASGENTEGTDAPETADAEKAEEAVVSGTADAEKAEETAVSGTAGAENETESDKLPGEVLETSDEQDGGAAAGKKKLRRWQKVLIGCLVAALVLCTGGYFVFDYFYGKMNYDDGSDAVQQEETFDKDDNAEGLNQLNPEDIQLDSAVGKEKDNDVINILLAGEEAIGDDRGRTDSIMIATLNMKDKAVRLTSIMRDAYVQIPGYSDNKINAAYHNGGIKLLKETIKVNFGIEVDGYVLVQFDSFENLIDALGGIDIELSEREVSYLNRTNYISDYTNHNLSVGMNHLNGNQALGYARVRYVEKGVYSGDFARTLRHRTVMKAIFDKYKEKSILELVQMVPELLPLVTTDLSKSQCVEYLGKFVQVRGENPELEMLNVPVEGAYRLAGVRGMSVVLLDDLATNVKAMQEFMYGGDGKEDKSEESTLTVGQ